LKKVFSHSFKNFTYVRQLFEKSFLTLFQKLYLKIFEKGFPRPFQKLYLREATFLKKVFSHSFKNFTYVRQLFEKSFLTLFQKLYLKVNGRVKDRVWQ